MLIVAHDVNPILPYLDRVVYLGRGRRGVGLAGVGAHRRRRSRSCIKRPIEVLRASDGRLVVVGAPEAASYHPGCITRTGSHSRDGAEANLFAYHFMINAFRAGTAVAMVAAVVGWFMVLRHANVRRSHAVGRRLSRRGRRGVARREREPRLLRVLRRRRAR